MSLDSATFKQAGQAGALGSQNVTQAEFREQINAINDAVRQLGGRVKIGPSDAVVNDPLNTPYILYVNADIGDDTLVVRQDVPYDYSTQEGVAEDEKDPMRRMSQQRLYCGYSPARPFRTLNRAVIEAGILTSRDYLDCCDNSRNAMRVTIVVTGEMDVINDKCPLDACANYFDEPITGTWRPTDAELVNFNPIDGGLLLPRGVSVVSMDLRKSIIRPTQVPCAVKESPTKSNRQAILKVTGQGYYYGFTFMDQCSNPSSHHLLDCFQFASKDELIEFYMKLVRKFGDVVPFSDKLALVDKTEYEIVGPNPPVPTEATDTTSSASPYIYNCSVRSNLGLCGIFCDGNKVEGFKSLVTAQFTGVSLQRDINAWQKYIGATDTWGKLDSYEEYITKSPDDLRMRPGWTSFHVRAINNAVIQEVSVFAIGQGVHHWVESGGECTITNSNSNFGGTAALAEGYNPEVAITDRGWTVAGIHRALDPFRKAQSWGTITLGNIDSYNEGKGIITLINPLQQSSEYPDQPDVIARMGYTLNGVAEEPSYIWVRNTKGPDYRAQLAANAWDPAEPNIIRLAEPFTTDNISGNIVPGGVVADETENEDYPKIGRDEAETLFIRRYKDTRNKDERTFWLILDGCGEMLRDPYRDYVIRDEDDAWSKEYLSAVARSKRDQTGCDTVDVVLRNCNDSVANAQHSETRWYRRGDTVLRRNKHYVAAVDHMGEFQSKNWNEGYVHTNSKFVPEGQILNIAPTLIFDGDIDEAEASGQCGFSKEHPLVLAQTQSAIDYQGVLNFYRCAGLDTEELKLTIKANQDKLYDDGIIANFHRPSNVRMFNHAWEWAGYLNYTKALPEYQQQISPVNKWTYYFTNKNGGKCYVSGFNEEGYQVTVKGLVDLATGDEIAAINLGTPEQDIEGEEPLRAALTIRDDSVRRRQEDAEGIVHIARIEEAVTDPKKKPDIDGKSYIEYYNNVLDTNGLGVLKKPWLDQYVIDKNFVQAPPAGISAVVIHVVPNQPLIGGASVPFGYPVDQYTEFDAKKWAAYGSPKTLTDGVRAAARVYVPVGAEIIVSVHSDVPSIEEGPLQLINSWAPIVIAGARGAGHPRVTLDKSVTENALGRFPQYLQQYSFSAGVTFADLTMDITGSRCYLTFNGGLGVGGDELILNLKDSGDISLINGSYGGSCRFMAYHRADPDGPDQAMIVNVESFDQSLNEGDRYVGVFSTLVGPLSQTGTGLVGSGVDLVIDMRGAGYGEPGRPTLTFKFTHTVNDGGSEPKLAFYNMGGRGGCRAGGRIGPIIDIDLNNNDWDLRGWVSKTWLQNQNYQGRHFQIRQPDNQNDRAVYNMTSRTLEIVEDYTFILTMGSSVDVNGSEFDAGPFGFIKGLETLAGRTNRNDLMLIADNKYGAYVYDQGPEDDRNKSNVSYAVGYIPVEEPDPDQ